MKAVTKSNAALKREMMALRLLAARLTEANAGLESALDTMRGERNHTHVELGKAREERDHLSKSAFLDAFLTPAADTSSSWASLVASAIGGFILGALAALISIG